MRKIILCMSLASVSGFLKSLDRAAIVLSHTFSKFEHEAYLVLCRGEAFMRANVGSLNVLKRLTINRS